MTKFIYITLAIFHAVLGISFAQPSVSLLKDVVPGTNGGCSSLFSGSASIEGRAVFTAGAGSLPSLWITDGTTAGTQIVDYDILGSPDMFVATTSGTIFFRGDKNSVTPALYKIEKDKITSQLIEIFSSNKIKGIVPFDSASVLMSVQSSGSPKPNELWISTGSNSGTVKLRNVETDPDKWQASNFKNQTVLHEKYFNAFSKLKPIITDGTDIGTVFVEDWAAPVSAFSEVMTAIGVGDWVLISGIGTNNQPKTSLTDGTTGGTFNLTIPSPANDFALGAVRDGNNLYIWGETSLNVVNLTTKTVTKLSAKMSYYGNPIIVNSKLYYYATNGTKVELWETGGTVASTQKMIGSPVIGTDYQNLKLIAVDTSLYYTVKGASSIDLWHYGLVSGQHKKVCDLLPASAGNVVPIIESVNGRLLFSRRTDTYGYEPWISASGVSALFEANTPFAALQFSPNPTVGAFTFELPEGKEVSLEVFNLLGKKLFTKKLEAGNTTATLDLSNLAAGQYWVISRSSDGRAAAGKVIKI